MANTRRYWDGTKWTDHVAPDDGDALGETPKTASAQPGRPRIQSAAVWFVLGLGVAVFVLLANLGVSATGYDCGSIMNPKSYAGRSAEDFASLDPTGSLGDSFTSAATASSAAAADTQNQNCSSARDSRQTFAIIAGALVPAIGLGFLRLRAKGAFKPA